MSKLVFRKGFTLFELMIVIVIIGVVYALMVQNFTFGKSKNETISLENLPTYLRKNFSTTKERVTFRCIDECFTCKIFVGGKEANASESFFEKYSSPTVYTLINDNLEKVEFVDYFVDYKNISVCFEYNLYPNKSSDKLVLEYKDNIYMYDNFFEKTQKFQTLSDAQDFWVNQRDKAKED